MDAGEITRLITFILWTFCGVFLMGFGVRAFRAKEAVGFWANAKTVPMADVKHYNLAVGKLWLAAGLVFILLGVPLLLTGQNSALVMFSVIGVMFWVIALMIIYTRIEAKYRKK